MYPRVQANRQNPFLESSWPCPITSEARTYPTSRCRKQQILEFFCTVIAPETEERKKNKRIISKTDGAKKAAQEGRCTTNQFFRLIIVLRFLS